MKASVIKKFHSRIRKGLTGGRRGPRRKPLNWQSVKVNLAKLCPDQPEKFWSAFYFVIELFEKYRCKEASVISYVLELALYQQEYVPGLRRVGDILRMTVVMRRDNPVQRSSRPMVHELLKLPYGYNNMETYSANDFIRNALSEDERFLNVLLRYGVMPMPLRPSCHAWIKFAFALAPVLKYPMEVQVAVIENIRFHLERIQPNLKRRMLTICEGIEVILHTIFRGRPETRARGFRMIFETIPEPIITIQEVRWLLETILRDVADGSFIDEICRKYEEQFPESCGSVTPRSLKHLCRYQIRQILRNDFNFPFGVHDLNLPAYLKKYVLLEADPHP